MLKRIRHFLGIYTKQEKFDNGYNAIVDAIKNKEWDLMRKLYYSASNNGFDFNEFDKGIIKAYKDWHNGNLVIKG